jgi:outer membrane immunogenic protein
MALGNHRRREYEYQEFSMKKLLLATGAMLIAGSAFAADIPRYQAEPAYQAPAPAVTWTGLYAGVNIGYAFSGDFDVPGWRLNQGSGWTGGLQGGYNYQFDPIVVGIEGSLGYSDISDKWMGGSGRTGFNGSITPRLGYAFGDFLPYVKAGIAGSNVELKYIRDDTNFQIGWTAGFGLEYRITPEISVRGEYNYTSYSRSDYDIDTLPTSALSNSDIRLGVNYHF